MECDQRVELAKKMALNNYIWVITRMIYEVDDEKMFAKMCSHWGGGNKKSLTGEEETKNHYKKKR